MKTTIDIADDLLMRAKAAARKDKTTLKALIESALRTVLDNRKRRKPKKVQPVVVHGETPLSEIANLHQLILADYDEHAMERLKRSGAY